jgi:S1-C subfamily serine protease
MLLTLVTVTALGLAACNSDDSSSPNPSSTVEATSRQSDLTTISSGSGDNPGQLSTVELVKLLRPSVVHIQADGAVGTGFIIDTEGHIVTNNHVITGGTNTVARSITVTLSDGSEESAEVVGHDRATDIAVLQIETEDLDPLDLGQSSGLQVGEAVLAMGHALNLPGGPTVTTGVVSAVNRVIEEDQDQINIPDAIQTDAAINRGNSGGPLVNMSGEVVGITTAVIRGNAEGIGLAISIDSAKPVIDELINNVARSTAAPRHQHRALGSSFAAFSCSVDASFEGVLIAEIQSNTPAESAGLQPCDLITSINDTDITSSADLFRALTEHRARETVQLDFERDGRDQSTDVTLG